MLVVNWRLVIPIFIIALVASAAIFLGERGFIFQKGGVELVEELEGGGLPADGEDFTIPAETLPEEFLTEEFNQDFFTVPIETKVQVRQCPEIGCQLLGHFEAGAEIMFNNADVTDEADWLPVRWPDPLAGPAAGWVEVNELLSGLQEPDLLPDTVVELEELKLGEIEPRPINPGALVGVVCEFRLPDTPPDSALKKFTRGSGVIVTTEGHLLTSRSVADITFINRGFENYELDHCLVGQLPPDNNLPTFETIRRSNAFFRLPYLNYTAAVVHIPVIGRPDKQESTPTASKEELEVIVEDPTKTTALSEYEQRWLDFALLKITGINPDALPFGGAAQLPDNFPTAPLLVSTVPPQNEPLLSFGFPSGTTVGQRADIRTLFLQGLISKVTNYWAGDKRYQKDLFLIETALETEDTAGGRFGSPLFWKGYVAGLHTVKQRRTLQVYNISSKAILENLYDNQLTLAIEVY